MDKMNFFAALPEIALLIGAALVLMADVYRAPGKPFNSHRLALVALALPVLATVWQINGIALQGNGTQYAFNDMYVADSLSHLLKLCAYIAVGTCIIYAHNYVAERDLHKGEFYGLALFSLLGQMVMISANNLLVLYVGLELMSLSLYALTALRRDHTASTEAAMKYFVLGALASGFLLYGMSMIYGGTGTLDMTDIARKFAMGQVNTTVFVFGLVFIVAGLAFKLGAVPFHMWLPDVYHGAPTAATLMIASAPKLAGFAIAFRLLAEALIGGANDWQQMLVVLSVLSIGLGNLVGIAQTNIKRMLAYSTIAQIGYMLLGLLSGVVDGSMKSAPNAYGGALFYIITYVLTTLGTFGMLQLLSRAGFESEEVADLRGLNKRSPWMALVMLVLMFSLAGIPPTVGFYAKLLVLGSVVNAGMVWLAVYAVLMSLVGAFYYLRVVKVMYFEEPIDASPIGAGADARALMAVNGALVLLLGVLPGPLMALCVDAIKQALST